MSNQDPDAFLEDLAERRHDARHNPPADDLRALDRAAGDHYERWLDQIGGSK